MLPWIFKPSTIKLKKPSTYSTWMLWESWEYNYYNLFPSSPGYFYIITFSKLLIYEHFVQQLGHRMLLEGNIRNKQKLCGSAYAKYEISHPLADFFLSRIQHIVLKKSWSSIWPVLKKSFITVWSPLIVVYVKSKVSYQIKVV